MPSGTRNLNYISADPENNNHRLNPSPLMINDQSLCCFYRNDWAVSSLEFVFISLFHYQELILQSVTVIYIHVPPSICNYILDSVLLSQWQRFSHNIWYMNFKHVCHMSTKKKVRFEAPSITSHLGHFNIYGEST